MRIDTAIERLIENYQYAVKDSSVKDKVAFALYLTWREEVLTEEPKKGKWIVKDIDEGYVECPFCGSLTTCEYEDAISDLHYCFNCGADMREEE